MAFDVQTVREQFPAVGEQVHGKPLVYLDNAATAQMPRPVMEAVIQLELCRGNVHRGITPSASGAPPPMSRRGPPPPPSLARRRNR